MAPVRALRLALALGALGCSFPDPPIANPNCPDRDGDGYPDAACQPGGDCCDDNFAVHPGQMGYFDQPYTCAAGAHPSYDYDCDGSEDPEPHPPAPMSCSAGDVTCAPNAGYDTDACGGTSGHECNKPMLTCTLVATKLAPLKCR